MKQPRPEREASQVLRLGKEVVDAFESHDSEAIERLDTYVEAFDAWQISTKGLALDGEIGRRIAAQHATIIAHAESMKDDVVRSLRTLRAKGKGLRAYMDHLPRRISTIRTRKG